jgi:hypothetical protein
MAIRRVLDGELLVNEPISMSLTALHPRSPSAELLAVRGAPYWWIPNLAGLRRYVTAAGLDIVDAGRPYFVANGAGRVIQSLPQQAASSWVRMQLLRRGSPHAWVLARTA